MIRPLAVLVSAILLSRPGMPAPQATRYAKVLNEEAAAHGFDPLTAVAIIHFETQWQPELVSTDGEDYGLGQVRARYTASCRDDEDPVDHPSEACQAAKARLLDGEHNIRRMARIIAANQALCKQKTGSAMAHHWLAGYQGYNIPSKNIWCQPGKKTWRVLRYRKELLAKLLPPPKKPARPKTAEHKTAPAARKHPIAEQPARKPLPPAVAKDKLAELREQAPPTHRPSAKSAAKTRPAVRSRRHTPAPGPPAGKAPGEG